MAGFLFDEIIFGPVMSRRLGISLGINLLPLDKKLCSFNCIYCECGWTDAIKDKGFFKYPSRKEVYKALENKLKQLIKTSNQPDSLTFAGNGEPTLHPEFPGIIDDTIELKNKYFPTALVTVLSNSSTVNDFEIFEALKKINNIMKLDTAIDSTYYLINQSSKKNRIQDIINGLVKFNGSVTIQTMFLKGEYKNTPIDNTSDNEIKAWLDAIIKINPEKIMIYSLDRLPPLSNLKKINTSELTKIANKANNMGFITEVY